MMRWGLIGASTIAAQHMIPAIRAQDECEIEWVVSGTKTHAESFAAEHDIPSYNTELKSALENDGVGAVYISSINDKHMQQAMLAIEHGKHVICEKPLALTVEDATKMVRAASEAGTSFATNHHLRCSGSHRTIKALLDSGSIGQPLSMRIFHAVHLPPHLQGWRINDASAGGGVIPDITVHDVDVVRYLLGEDPVAVVAQMATSGMGDGVEDSAMSVWQMPSGTMVMSHESFTHRFAGSGLEIHGTDASIFATGVMTQNPVGEITLVSAKGRESITFPDHDLYFKAVGEFMDAVNGEGKPAATGIDGIKSLGVALAIRKSAEHGQRVKVDYGEMK